MKAVCRCEGSLLCGLCPRQVSSVSVAARPLTALLSPCITLTAWATSHTMGNMRFSLIHSAALATRLSTYTPAGTTAWGSSRISPLFQGSWGRETRTGTAGSLLVPAVTTITVSNWPQSDHGRRQTMPATMAEPGRHCGWPSKHTVPAHNLISYLKLYSPDNLFSLLVTIPTCKNVRMASGQPHCQPITVDTPSITINSG